MTAAAQHRFPTASLQLFDWITERLKSPEPYHDEQSDTWHVFRHADIAAILADPAAFSSDPKELQPQSPVLERFSGGNMVRMDAPRHPMLRGLVKKVFTRGRVAALEPRIAAITTELLDELPARADADGVADLVAGLTYPMPIIVIAELLGVPASDRGKFREWADVLLSSQIDQSEAVLSSDAVDKIAPAMAALHDYSLDQVSLRRQAPGSDLISALLAAEVDGERLTDAEIATFAVVLLIAGHVTTTVFLGSSLLCLDANPAARAAVMADPTLIPAAVEESMRFQPPLPRSLRRTTRDVEIAGRTIPANKPLVVWLAAANRDPAVFADPDTFDLHRSPNPHLTFGIGPHFCIGAPLARLETRVALGELLRRFPELELAGTPEHYPSVSMLVGPTRLPVRTGMR